MSVLNRRSGDGGVTEMPEAKPGPIVRLRTFLSEVMSELKKIDLAFAQGGLRHDPGRDRGRLHHAVYLFVVDKTLERG